MESNLDIFYNEDFLYVATSDGTIKKINIKYVANKLWEKNIELR